jgi:hypothetical protein
MCINYISTEFKPKYSDFSVIRIFGWLGRFLTIAQCFQFVLLITVYYYYYYYFYYFVVVFCYVRCSRFKEFSYNFDC